MSSPRKYSSPYLTSLPGLPAASVPKNKKRSKSSLPTTKATPSSNPIGPSNSNATNASNTSVDDQITYDPSSGDVDKNSLEDIKKASATAKPFDIVLSDDNIGAAQCADTSIDTSIKINSVTNLRSVSNVLSNANSENRRNITSRSESDIKNIRESEKKAEAEEECLTGAATSLPSLKSILKLPTASSYQSKSKFKTDHDDTSNRKLVSSRGSKKKTGKLDNNEVREKDYHYNPSIAPSTNANTKTRFGAALEGTTMGPVPSKLEIFQQKYARNNNKSPRRKVKAKTERSLPVPLMPKKSVRFSTKIDIYNVPYESRAGSRACDWQRNMLEQRIQNFRQLMRDVGSPEDVDIFTSGASMIFPGYPYPLPNSNFSLRGGGRGGGGRNFKF